MHYKNTRRAEADSANISEGSQDLSGRDFREPSSRTEYTSKQLETKLKVVEKEQGELPAAAYAMKLGGSIASDIGRRSVWSVIRKWADNHKRLHRTKCKDGTSDSEMRSNKRWFKAYFCGTQDDEHNFEGRPRLPLWTRVRRCFENEEEVDNRGVWKQVGVRQASPGPMIRLCIGAFSSKTLPSRKRLINLGRTQTSTCSISRIRSL